MNKPVLLATFTAALTTAAVLVPVPAAQAAGCISRAEYRTVHKGDSKATVARKAGIAGTRQVFSTSGGYTFEVRAYKTCTPFSVVTMGFDNGRMSNKFAVWTS